MLQKWDMNDQVLSQTMFLADEVQYNLLHRICESRNSKCLKTTDEQMIFAQSEGQNAWLWVSKELEEDRRHNVFQELVELLNGTAVPGVSGDPTMVEHFAQMYSETNDVPYFPHMIMESYSCSEVKKPHNVRGTMHQATRHHVEIVAAFLAGFSEGAYGVIVDPASQISTAEEMVKAGNVYLWYVDRLPVSMANIAHRSPRHARINAVYTPSLFRKRGYASALVAEICSVLESEGLEPMLYADLKNPDSNKVYQNIGFQERGKVVDIKFR
ncbi:GNAT family N-acetyltransferase [Paenibacillus pabuli]|uniref:GNAT family N-acetyltransferase n=1 Tax=Paenibacillus pabuli TaxID=1472 RepID=UPI0007862A96|nr:GNAT family N-acetyltransferase [Paenibacillus pabuli]MEC0127033.1 GNAT family N-acetyltransferase [Paenibacillus pabuli]